MESNKTPPPMQSSPSPTVDSSIRTSTRKRRSAASTFTSGSTSGQSSAKRRHVTATPRTKKGRKSKQEHQDPPKINLDDPDDPYNFAANSDVHPEPLKNISIERSSFGEVRYTKSLPGSADRYANIERIAAGRNPQLATSSSVIPSLDHPMSLSMLSSNSLRLELSTSIDNATEPGTPASSKSSSRKTNRAKGSSEIDEFQMDEDEPKTPKRKGRASKNATQKDQKEINDNDSPPPKKATPRSGQKSKSDYWPTVTPKSDKKPKDDDELYIVPQLNSQEQFAVDHPVDMNHFLQPGTRVLALWGNDYYASNICGREALGRYYVHFVEDNLNRVLPPSGVIPISFLAPGLRISFIDTVDDEEVGKVSEVIKQPVEQGSENAENWVQGEFQLRELDEDLNPSAEIKIIPWTKLYLTKDQAGQILHGKVFNPVIRVDQENIVNESRTTRRSRSMRTNTTADAEQMATTPKNIGITSSPIPRGSSIRRQAGLPSKKDVAIAEESAKKEEIPMESDGEKRLNEDKAIMKTPTKEDYKLKKEESPQIKASNPPNEDPEEKDLNVSMDSANTTTDEAGGSPTSPNTPKNASNGNYRTGQLSEQEKSPMSSNSTPQQNSENGNVQSNGVSSTTSPKTSIHPPNIFTRLKFVLTSANRPNKVSDFNKREYRATIEDRGGQVIEDFSSLEPEETAYLIADTYYRTHKYLCALSLSIPCINYKWIQKCVMENKLVDYQPYLLPSGESTLDPATVFKWKPIKGQLFKDKRVLVYTRYFSEDPKIIPFGEIWAPLMRNLGAILVGLSPDEPFSKETYKSATLAQKHAFCDENHFDVLLAENDCEPELAEKAEALGAIAVSSEWVIQAIVCGELPDVNSSERFRYDFI